jgi:ribosomal protein L37AE/L43A
MSEYSYFSDIQPQELLCPACGAELNNEDKTGDGWQCHSCGDFIPTEMAVKPYKGVSNQHKMSSVWR